MKTPFHTSRGSITLVALSLAVIIGISLASYLALCQQTLRLSTRSIQLSRARLLAEVGLETGLDSLNNTSSDPWPTALWSNAPTAQDKTGVFPPPFYSAPPFDLGEGATGTFTTVVTKYNTAAPTIKSTATVTVPGLGVFTKTLVATAKPAPLFANAIGVIGGSLTLPAGTIVDSWDSDYDPAAIAPTPKWDNNKFTSPVLYSSVSPLPPTSTNSHSYAAVVAAPSMTLAGDATVYGYAATLGNPINNPSANAVIKGPSTPVSTKIDPNRVSKSAFIPTFTAAAPSPLVTGAWASLPAYGAWGMVQQIGVPAGPIQYWNVGTSLLLDGSKILRVVGPVVLVINQDLVLKDDAQIQIVGPGSRLEIYVRDDLTISNNAGFYNLTNEPKNLGLFCTSQYSGNATFSYSSTADFNGVIYASDDNQGMNFATSPEIHGAILAGFTPNFSAPNLKLHYDTALQYLPKGWFQYVTTPFILVQVTEL